MQAHSCQSCLMPFAKDPGQRENDQYCSLCFKNGELQYKGDNLKEFQAVAYQSMLARGTPKWKAKLFTWSIRFAPRWKGKK